MLDMNFSETFPKVANHVEMKKTNNKSFVGTLTWLPTS